MIWSTVVCLCVSTKNPRVWVCSDQTGSKRPEGFTLVPWQSGKAPCWDVAITCPLAESYCTSLQPLERQRCGGRTCRFPQGREIRWSWCPLHFLAHCYWDSGSFQQSACQLLSDLGKKISQSSGEVRKSHSVPEMLSAGDAALQRHFTAQQFASPWLHATDW